MTAHLTLAPYSDGSWTWGLYVPRVGVLERPPGKVYRDKEAARKGARRAAAALGWTVSERVDSQ